MKVESPNLRALIQNHWNKAYTVNTPAAQLLKHQRQLWFTTSSLSVQWAGSRCESSHNTQHNSPDSFIPLLSTFPTNKNIRMMARLSKTGFWWIHWRSIVRIPPKKVHHVFSTALYPEIFESIQGNSSLGKNVTTRGGLNDFLPAVQRAGNGCLIDTSLFTCLLTGTLMNVVLSIPCVCVCQCLCIDNSTLHPSLI